MKQFIIRKSIEFRIQILLILSISLFPNLSNGQPNACDCEPVTTLKHFVYVTECSPPDMPINNNSDCGTWDPNCMCYITSTPLSAVILEYTETVCGGNIAIVFKSATFFGPMYASPTPGNFGNQSRDYPLAQQALLSSLGSANLSFVYPAGCQTVASVTYPDPSPCYYFWPEGPLAGKIQAIVNLGNPSPILELLPCEGENCCRLDYTYDVNTHRYTLVNFNPIQPCPANPPTITTKQFHCMDINNRPITYTGTVTYPRPCESYCGAELNTLFKTSKESKFEPLPDFAKFNISPIPAKDNIYFSSTENISKIEIYDMSGKKIEKVFLVEKDKLNISDLAESTYYVKIYFDNNSLRTIKIIKN